MFHFGSSVLGGMGAILFPFFYSFRGNMDWLKKRLSERSTWKGLIWLLTACGITLNAEQAEAIVATGLAIAGLVDVFLTDKK